MPQPRHRRGGAAGPAALLRDRAPGTEGEPAATPAHEEAKTLLAGLARPGLRIWVIDSKLKLVAAAGSLDAPAPQSASSVFGPIERAVHFALQPLFERMFRTPAAPGEELIPDDVVFGGRELERALDGAPTTRRRPAPGGRGTTSRHPIRVERRTVIGAVVLEKTPTRSSRSQSRVRALVAVTLVAFSAGRWCCSHLPRACRGGCAGCVTRRRTQSIPWARRALLAGGHARDEIGDLSRSFSTVLARLADQTPISRRSQPASPTSCARRSRWCLVTRQPELQGGNPPAPLPRRADDGLQRLEKILTACPSLAPRATGARRRTEPFDARAILESCAAATRARMRRAASASDCRTPQCRQRLGRPFRADAGQARRQCRGFRHG